MRSILAGLRFLILPTNATPPTVGQPIILLDPQGSKSLGTVTNAPEIDFYTGDADEELPGSLRGFANAFGQLGMELLSAKRNNSTRRALVGIFSGPDALPDRAEIILDSPYVLLDLTDPSLVGGVDFQTDAGTWSITETNIADDQSIFEFDWGKGWWSPASVQMAQQFDFNTTNDTGKSNTAYATPSPAVSVVFTAPPSGRGFITYGGQATWIFAAAAPIARHIFCAPKLRNGGTPGSGSDPGLVEFVASPSDDHSIGHGLTHPTGTGSLGPSGFRGVAMVDGLTAGNVYNLQLQWRCNSATTFTYDIEYQMIGWDPMV